MNNILAGSMYKAGVDALANAILADPRFLTVLMASALNAYLAKQTETLTQIVKENAEKIKKKQQNYPARVYAPYEQGVK